MAVTITNSTIEALNTVTEVTRSLATVDTDNSTEVFTFTPTVSGGKLLIVFVNDNLLQSDAANNDSTFSIAAGDFAYGAAAITGTVTVDKVECIQVETVRVLQDDGTVAITMTPGTDDKLTADNALAITVYELL